MQKKFEFVLSGVLLIGAILFALLPLASHKPTIDDVEVLFGASTRVQTTSAASVGYAATVASTWSGNTTTGNTILCEVSFNNDVAGYVTGITDSQSNTYLRIASGDSGGDTQGTIWYSYNITGGTTPTVTATVIGTHDMAMICREYSGLTTTDPLDQYAQGATVSGTSHTSATTPATTQNNELVFVGISLSANGSCTAGSGYGNAASQNASDLFEAACVEDKDVTTTGTQQATFTTSASVATYTIVATLKEAAGCDPNSGYCTDVFSKPGYTTWTAPSGVTSADVACWGGGGGGGDGSASGGGAGGGGGAFASSTASGLTGGSSVIRIFVGAGGAGGGAGAAGSIGATSTASTTAPATIVAAGPGKGGAINNGAGGAGGLASASTGTVKNNGGTGGNGDANGTTQDTGGGGGGAGGPHGAGGTGAIGAATTGGGGGGGNGGSNGSGATGGASTNGGAGGNGGNGAAADGKIGLFARWGGGGAGGGDNANNGGAGIGFGGGGGGGENQGGNGASGGCTITYTASGGGGGGGAAPAVQSEFFFE